MEQGEYQNSETEGVHTNGNNHTENHNDKEKRKRRSKNDPTGRQHKCEVCGKTYLSRPALSQHIKTKHQDVLGEYKRGRGRPRKNDAENLSHPNNNKYEEFFAKSNRAKAEEGAFDFRAELRIALLELFAGKHSLVLREEGKDSSTHPLLLQKIEEEAETKKVVYDESILRYLEEIAPKVNKAYFHFVSKFCILFRESFNRLKKKENPNLSVDFSTENTAEEVPDKCNDFVTEFMEVNNYFDLDSNEIIDIIQHFCHWLYEKSFTTSVLSLM